MVHLKVNMYSPYDKCWSNERSALLEIPARYTFAIVHK